MDRWRGIPTLGREKIENCLAKDERILRAWLLCFVNKIGTEAKGSIICSVGERVPTVYSSVERQCNEAEHFLVLGTA